MTGSAASARFASPVASFDPGQLLRPLRRTFSLSVGAAALLHGTVALMSPFDGALTGTPRPLTHRFVKREPRLTKPLELRKLPRPKRVAIRRYFKPLPAARMDRVQATAAFDAAVVVSRTALPWGEPNESEMEHLTRYLLSGGFLFGPVTERMQEGLIKYGGLVRGQDFRSERLPESHPVFHSFFDLDVVPSGYWSGTSAKWQGWLHTTGYFIDGRLAAIETSNYRGWFNHLYSGDSTRQLQMAVNVVVFALTQEGSMTQRLMQMLN